ncbi:hypothetical protein Slin15195_G035550 [Septoria linicola]|uniref:Uncharacterized protein n=1 Tax=Septoria linicola TaxID=215465 RepID=A0A9Q9EFX4_9PEZI|nr:hypothetical protein Slin14017_G116910 [Septoria linicola]USW50236.1 hypothetical protein Slin15195_G035550 [Septoria linicola]
MNMVKLMFELLEFCYQVGKGSISAAVESRFRNEAMCDAGLLQYPVVAAPQLDASEDFLHHREQRMARLQGALQIPELHETAPYTFYLKTSWAKREVVKAMDKSEVVQGLKRAAILKELFIN